MIQNFVSLPMYDWPELQIHNDVFYEGLKESLAAYGFDTPEKLSRENDLQTDWQNDALLLSQTCGLPLVTDLENKVALVGTPAYGIPSKAGQYHSVFIVRKNSPLNKLEDLSGKRFVFSGYGSQSGFGAPMHTLMSNGIAPADLNTLPPSGAHRQSVKLVATGAADFAGIDAVSWEMAKRFESTAEKLRVIERTEPTFGLPCITSLQYVDRRDDLFDAVTKAIDFLDNKTKKALLLTDFIKTTLSDYQIIKSRILNIRKNCIS